MIALIRKELRQHALFLTVAVALSLGLLLGDDRGERFLEPSLERQLVYALLVPMLAAAVLGGYQIANEEKEQTLSYLVHRELGRRELLGAKAIAGLALVAVVAFVPPTLSYASARLSSTLRDVVLPARLVEQLCAATAAFPAYAAGAFAATLRGSVRTRMGLATLGGFSLLVLVALVLRADLAGPTVGLVAFPVACALATAFWLAATAARPLGCEPGQRSGRPGATLFRAAAALPLLVAGAWVAAFAGELASLGARGTLPVVVELHDGDDGAPPRFAAVAEQERGDLRPVPRRSTWTGDAWLDSDEVDRGGLGARWLSLDQFPFFSWKRGLRAGPIAGAWLDEDAGVVRAIWARAEPGALARGDVAWYVLAPSWGRFATDTVAVHSLSDRGSTVSLFDPAVGRVAVLRAGADAPELVEIEAPDGDRFVAAERGWGEVSIPNAILAGRMTVLRGESHDYYLRAGELVRSADKLAFAEVEDGRPLLRSDDDPLRPKRAVVAAGDETLWSGEHRVAGARRPLEAAALALDLARGPLVALTSYAADGDPGGARLALLRSPLLVAGRRPWLLGVHVAFALLLAALVWRRLGGRRASPARAVAWGIAVLIAGPAAFVVHLLVEPPRVRAASTASAPRPLLTSGAKPA